MYKIFLCELQNLQNEFWRHGTNYFDRMPSKGIFFIIDGSLGNRCEVVHIPASGGNHTDYKRKPLFVYKCEEHYDACLSVKNDGDIKCSENALNYEVKPSNDKSQYLKRDCKQLLH